MSFEVANSCALGKSKEVGLKTLSAAFERRGHHLETQHCKVDIGEVCWVAMIVFVSLDVALVFLLFVGNFYFLVNFDMNHKLFLPFDLTIDM